MAWIEDSLKTFQTNKVVLECVSLLNIESSGWFFGLLNAFFFTLFLIYSILYFKLPAPLYFLFYLISCPNRNTARLIKHVFADKEGLLQNHVLHTPGCEGERSVISESNRTAALQL